MMADDPENDAPETPGASGGRKGILGTIRAALRHPEAHLLLWGAAALGLFLLVRQFGQQGAAQVAAATDATTAAGTAAGASIPDPLTGVGNVFDPGTGAGGGGGGGGGTAGGSGGGGAGSTGLFGTLGNAISAALGQAVTTARTTAGGGQGGMVGAVGAAAQHGITQGAAAVPIGHGSGAPINSALASSQLAHRGITHYGVETSPGPHPAQVNHAAPRVPSHPVAPPVTSTINHYQAHALALQGNGV